MSAFDPSDFYVGYRKRAPRAVGRFLRPRLAILLGIAVAVAAAIAATQQPFEPGSFAFGQPESFEGTLLARPYPRLWTERGPRGAPGFVGLVAFGKHGAAVEHLDGRRVRLQGTRIERGDQMMVEIVGGSIEPLDGVPPAPPPAVEDLGVQTLVGEVVDSKCYLGVMRPGRRRTHRACAALCIRGGIPPILAARGPGGRRRHLLLTDAGGQPINAKVLDLVAEPVEITGRVTRQGNLYYLAAEREAYRRRGG